MKNTNFKEYSVHTVVRNLDFLLRKTEDKVILVAADYPREPLLQSTVSLVEGLVDIYKRNIMILDFNESNKKDCLFYHNLKDLDLIKTSGVLDEVKLKIYIEECKKHYQNILVLPHIRRNREKTQLPNIDFDSSIIMRSSKSISEYSKNVVTKKVIDSQIKVRAIVDMGI